MESSIMKLLEEDEDENLHSGADVEAFTAALNRDIGGVGGVDISVPPSVDSDAGVSSVVSNSTSDQLIGQRQASGQEESLACQDQKQEQLQHSLPWKQDSCEIEPVPPGPVVENKNHDYVSPLESEKRMLQYSQTQDDTQHQQIEQNTIQLSEENQIQVSEKDSDQLIGQWQTSGQEESLGCQDQKQEQLQHSLPQKEDSCEIEPVPPGPEVENKNQDDISSLESEQRTLQYSQTQDDTQHQQIEQNTIQLSEENQIQVSEKDSVQHPEQEKIHHPGSQYQYRKLPHLNNEQTPVTDHVNSTVRRIPFQAIFLMLRPNLEKDRAMQLEAVFNKLRKNEVNKEGFLRIVRNIVGEQMLRRVVTWIQTQQPAEAQATGISQMAPHQYQPQSQVSLQQPHLPSSSAQQLAESQRHLQHHSTSSNQFQKGPGAPTSQFPTPGPAVQNKENLGEISTEADHLSDAQVTHISQMPYANMSIVKRERETPMVSAAVVNKQQQQQLHTPPSSFPKYGGAVGNYNSHTYSGPSVSVPATSTQTQDPHIRPIPHLQGGMVSTQQGTSQSKNPMNVPRHELRNKGIENKRVQGGPLTHMPSQPTLPPNSGGWQSSLNKDQKSSGLTSSSSFGPVHIDQGNSNVGPSKEEAIEKQSARMGFPTSAIMMTSDQISGPVLAQPDATMQMRSQMSSAATPVGAATNARTSPKKPPVGQKRPIEAVGTLSPISSKKQKVSGAPLDRSIEHLNDVTAVSGVNLREEEEQLLSALKDDSRASEATRRVVQEEEERLILQRGPLQKKIEEIISKCGLKSTSNDVERCLSMCVEERLRGLISSLIRLSKQRVDIEKPSHRIFITSDVQRQILMMNQKAKEDWEKKQAEKAEKLRKQNDTDGNTGADADKDKDEGRTKATKANKEEDDKMRATAANVAARAAVGGDDMLSKWQLMAEQARQKREGGQDGASSTIPVKDLGRRPLSASGKTMRDNREADRGPSVAASGPMRKFGRNLAIIPQTKVACSISIKDVISVLEREPQMSKSTLIYRLYERGALAVMAE